MFPSSAIRKLARKHGLDLNTVTGTGVRGRITRRDVEAVIAGGTTVPAPRAVVPASGERREKMSMLRKTISKRMALSWQEIPHVFTRLDVDATQLLEARTVLAEELGRKVPLEALLIKAEGLDDLRTDIL